MPSHDQGRERGGHDANRRDARQGAWWEVNFAKNLLRSGVQQRQALSRVFAARREETGERVRTQGGTPRPAPVGGHMKEVRKLPCQRGAQGAGRRVRERTGLRRPAGEIIRQGQDVHPAPRVHPPQHLRARPARAPEPRLQALNAPEDQWPDRQQIPGQGLYGGEQATVHRP